MTKDQMIDKLQNILKHERKHFEFYFQASVMVKGYERLFLKPLFEKEMAGELEHMRQFADKIVALGGHPTVETHHWGIYGGTTANTGYHLLKWAISMEREVLAEYHGLYDDAEKFAIINNDMSIALLLEENIEHTTADVEEMEKILEGLPNQEQDLRSQK